MDKLTIFLENFLKKAVCVNKHTKVIILTENYDMIATLSEWQEKLVTTVDRKANPGTLVKT